MWTCVLKKKKEENHNTNNSSEVEADMANLNGVDTQIYCVKEEC